MGRCSPGPCGQVQDPNNAGTDLNEDMINNLVFTHQACKPATYVNTEKAAILKENESQPVICHMLTCHPVSHS